MARVAERRRYVDHRRFLVTRRGILVHGSHSLVAVHKGTVSAHTDSTARAERTRSVTAAPANL